MTLATDGERLGMQIDFGDGMVPGVDLSSMRLQAVIHAGGDSASVGIVLPPDVAAQMGGGIGLRLDLAIPDTIRHSAMPNIDSIMAAEQGDEPEVVNTGRTSTVAGVTCEEWELTSQNQDSIPFGGKIGMCLVEQLPALRAFTSLFEKYLPDLGVDFGEMKERGRKWFGGRDLVAIRTIMGDNQDMVVQLESSSGTAPDASFFVLPEGLQPFPLEALKNMAGGAMQTGT
jgi:hypothetical protein